MAKAAGRINLPFTNGFYQSRSKPLSSQRCVNWYPNDAKIPSLNESNLYATPGLSSVVEGLDGIGRGSHSFNGVLYIVSGSKLYRIDRTVSPDGAESYAAVEIGDIDGDGQVVMDSTKNQLVVVVPDNFAYLYDGSTLHNLLIVSNFDGPVRDVKQIDSVFVFAKSNSNAVFHSNINDGLTYSALDRWEITQFPVIIGLMVYRGQIYAMGEAITVPFYNAAGLQFLFRPIPNGVIDSGLAGTFAKSPFRGSFVYLGAGENAEQTVWLFSGGSPRNISDETIDYIIQNESREVLQNARIQRHSQDGAEFICLWFGDYCFVYDLAAGRWHERRSRIPFDADYLDTPWRPVTITQIYNKVFVTDSSEGILGVIDDQVATEYGIEIFRRVICQPFMNQGIRVKVWAIEAYFSVGYGGDEKLQLRYSDDGGFTWSNFISRDLGEVGQYGRRVVFDRMGSFSNSRILEFVYTGVNPANFMKLMSNIS